MHELSISKAIAETALAHAGGRPVRAVSVRVGALRQVVPPTLAFCFEAVAADAGCPGARLEVEAVPALLRCEGCGSEWDPAPPPATAEDELAPLPSFRCTACGAAAAQVVRGDELEVESIEVSEEEEACTGPR